MRIAAALSLAFAVAACSSDGLTQNDMTVPPDLTPPAPDLTAPAGDVGNPCSSAGDCNSGERCIPDSFFPGGYCTLDCSHTACPTGSQCINAGGGRQFCALDCQTDGDCRDGYSCQSQICIPTKGNGGGVTPGTNAGAACVTPTVQPTAGGFGPNAEISSSGHSAIEAETEISVDPSTKNVVVAWIAILANFSSDIGWSTSTSDGASFAAPQFIGAAKTGVAGQEQSDPVVANDGAGNFYISWVAFNSSKQNPNPTNMIVYVAHSGDGGLTFPDVIAATPQGEWTTGGFLDKPWVAVSPKDGSVWVTWDRQANANSPVDVRVARSTDHGKTWAPPIAISDTAARPDADRNLCQITVGADGRAFATWVEVLSEQFGAPANAVYFQRFNADGSRDGKNVKVTAATDSPAFEDPSIGVDQKTGALYVGFVSGTPKGDWDVRVAASLDGGNTWAPSVKANDDATCATHFHHQLVVDGKGGVHAIWYDNRYLVGNVFHAAAPAVDATHPLAFGMNTFVDDRSHTFTTRRDMSNWIGDYLGLWATGDEIYACWTDPRTANQSHIYFAKGKL